MATKEDKMLLISEVAKLTGVSVNTIRAWARTNQLAVAEMRPVLVGMAWYTTVAAVKERVAQPRKTGRPLKKR